MRVALCQMNREWENKEVNTQRALTFLKAAAVHKVDAIFFPEMTLTGFSMNINATKENDMKSVKMFQEYASKYHLAVGLGWVKDCGKKAENHYTIIDENGQMISDYAKIHPFSYAGEDQYFASGNEVTTFQIKGRSFSNFICYDLRFPEIFQAVSSDVDIIVVPANWPERRSVQWKSLLQARAIENQVYMLGINCVGLEGGQNYSGDSRVIDPLGNIMEELSEKESIVLCDIPDDVNKIRSTFPVQNDRKPELYIELYKIRKQ